MNLSERDQEQVAEYRRALRAWQEDRWRRIVRSDVLAGARAEHLAVGVRPHVEAWLAGPPGALVFYGPTGTGKTYAAAAAARARFEAGDLVEFWPAVRLFDQLRPDGTVTLSMLLDVDVLVLDDLGGEKASEWTREQLDAIVDARSTEGRRTIITTNATPAAFEDRLHERVWSRLSAIAVGVIVNGPDRRLSR